ncbi:MAG: nickel pincer cofactor biosynthesis protein LarB [Thermoguttaceae bacterium]
MEDKKDKMDHKLIFQWAEDLLQGRISADQMVQAIGGQQPGIADLGDTQLDLDRFRRCGFPEVIYAAGKTVETLKNIFTVLIEKKVEVFATRLEQEKADQLLPDFPDARYNPLARTIRISTGSERPTVGRVGILTAGTSDQPVAEEAFETVLWTGAEPVLIQDVGVAGPHRLRASLPKLSGVDAVIVVAGMEGALPSVVGGYVNVPVIAVPTSVGYGASFNGVAALLGMLNSCASNVTVVNIDAGFKAGYVAGLIAKNRWTTE